MSCEHSLNGKSWFEIARARCTFCLWGVFRDKLPPDELLRGLVHDSLRIWFCAPKDCHRKYVVIPYMERK